MKNNWKSKVCGNFKIYKSLDKYSGMLQLQMQLVKIAFKREKVQKPIKIQYLGPEIIDYSPELSKTT